MPYDSPLAHPQAYISKIGALSNAGVTIDAEAAKAKRNAEEYASKYSSDFSLVTSLADFNNQFYDVSE